MADSAPVIVSKARAVVLVGLAAAALGLGGLALYGHLPIHWPTPPAPTPIPPPDPAPADLAPKATVSGLFWPAPQPPNAVRATGDTPVPIGMIRLDGSASQSAKPLRWKVRGPAVKLRIYTPDGSLGGSVAEADILEYGRYHFHGTAIGTVKGEPDTDTDSVTFQVEAPKPPTPDPKPPTPEPVPPGPTPTPEPPKPPAPPEPPAPIAGDGLRVLFIYESADLSKYPKDQLAVFYDQGFRDYLAATCVKVNGVPDWRIYDKDIDMSNESKIWQDAMKRNHPELPWMVVSNGKTGYEGKVPANLAETKALVQKYADAK